MIKDEERTTDNWGLLGHQWAVEMLKQHITHQAVRHAYLLTGPGGLGRRTLALRFAQALACPQPPAAAVPCGTCQTCRQIEAMQFPDLAVVQAEKEGGVLKVEQVRAVQHNLSLKPYQAAYRLALFLRFEEANPSAANALLKTLEEAPAHAILILTAGDAEALLPTIVSRCEVLRLRPLTVEAVEAFLLTRGAGADEARLLAHVSGGRPGQAVRLLLDKKSTTLRRQRLDEVATLLSASRRQRFVFAETLAKDKDGFRNSLLIWQSYWRDVLLRHTGAGAPLANVDRETEIAALANRLELGELRRLIRDSELAVERLEKNLNTRLLAEVLLLDWPRF
ncbi:MAG: DNA polymerase III subunit delta' [Anaerolineales bacterium]|nr:DNA polymerase III subunit delta' [Anaerolineales bacterium]